MSRWRHIPHPASFSFPSDTTQSINPNATTCVYANLQTFCRPSYFPFNSVAHIDFVISDGQRQTFIGMHALRIRRPGTFPPGLIILNSTALQEGVGCLIPMLLIIFQAVIQKVSIKSGRQMSAVLREVILSIRLVFLSFAVYSFPLLLSLLFHPPSHRNLYSSTPLTMTLL